MNTLFLDRSTDKPSVALVASDGAVTAATFDDLDARSGEWNSRVLEFLGGIVPDRIAVGTGPGSFAGIRSALAFAQGYAIGSGCEVVGLTSAAAFAAAEGPLAVIGDARRGMFWVALFDGPRLAVPVFQVKEEELALRVPLSAPVITPDAKRIDAKLKEIFEDRYRGGAVPTAEGLAKAAVANPSLLAPEPLPIYLNPAVRD